MLVDSLFFKCMIYIGKAYLFISLIFVNKHVYLNFAVMQSINFFDIKCDIPELRGDNYKVWKERILLHLGWMDIDYAIRKDEPPSVTQTSTPSEIANYELWERSNRLSVMFIKIKISVGVCGSVDKHENVRELLKAIDE